MPGFTSRQTEPTRQFLDQPSNTSEATEDPSTYRSRSIEADIRPIPGCGTPCVGCSCGPLTFVMAMGYNVWITALPVTPSTRVFGRLPDGVGVTVASRSGECRVDSLSVLVTVGTSPGPGATGVITPGIYNIGRWTQVVGATVGTAQNKDLWTSPVWDDDYVYSTGGGGSGVQATAHFSNHPWSFDGQAVTIEATAVTGGGAFYHYRKWFQPARATPQFDPRYQNILLSDWQNDSRNLVPDRPTLLESIDCCPALGDRPRNETGAKVRSRIPSWTTPGPSYHEEIWDDPGNQYLAYEKRYEGCGSGCVGGSRSRVKLRKLIFNKNYVSPRIDFTGSQNDEFVLPKSTYHANAYGHPRSYGDFLDSCNCDCS